MFELAVIVEMACIDLGGVSPWLIVGCIFAAMCVIGLAPMLRLYLFPRNLGDVDLSGFGGQTWPTVTVIVPACDEEAMIRQAIESLLGLDYPALKVVAVDDRSKDRTGRILDELAPADGRLQVIHVSELPSGWLGKNHANWMGASRSDSEWILFTDGDVVFDANALKRAVCFAEAEGLDHLALVPGLIPGGTWENAMAYAFVFFFALTFRPWSVRNPRKRSYIGVGAFNLIRRSAYERLGTHQRLALEVVDDTKLGKLVKQAGLSQDILNGTEHIRVRWQRGLRGIVTGLEKNAFAAFDYSAAKAIAGTLPVAFVLGFAYGAAVLVPGLDRAGYVIGLAMIHLTFAVLLWRGHRNVALTALFPATFAIMLYIVYRSTYITMRRGGVTWRDTFYPLDDLRKGSV